MRIPAWGQDAEDMLSSTLWFHVGGGPCECPPAHQVVLLYCWPCVLGCTCGHLPGFGEGTRSCHLPSRAYLCPHWGERSTVDLGTHILPAGHPGIPRTIQSILVAHLGAGCRPLCQFMFGHPALSPSVRHSSRPWSQIMLRVWKAFMEKLGATVSLTSMYQPQSNGQVETTNQELGRFLKSHCQVQQGEWAWFLPWAKYVQNSLRHSSIGLTPFHSAHMRLQSVICSQKDQVNRHRSEAPVFHPGVHVWLSTRNLLLHLPIRKLSTRTVVAGPPADAVSRDTPPPPRTTRGPPPMLLGPSWTPDIMGVGSSTWWTGTGMVLRSALSCLILLPPSGARCRRSTNHLSWQPTLCTPGNHHCTHLDFFTTLITLPSYSPHQPQS
ncbi:uncharacterized protein LOC116375739 isoform X3 [Oncorhynchus kisutch]|uniref:uncharacterized protein LOC116375739 isoform X3 n=1 Tax=Oncorhynchus kisutch TaxID=8019 RepID=UPI0012DEA195|nr:uncharacterized protein LOC116375739 isoform X3 [Oncorhynchus kisutch]